MIIAESTRLYLRQLNDEDADSLALVLSDEASMVHYPRPFTIEEVRQWIQKNIRRYENDGFGLWAVIRKKNSIFLGDCGITIQNIDGEMLPEIGFHIIKQYCNQGYASEAAQLCLQYVKKNLPYTKVYSYSQATNIPSQRVSEKIGMKLKKIYLKFGIEHVVYEYNFIDDPNENLEKLMATRKKCE